MIHQLRIYEISTRTSRPSTRGFVITLRG